MKLWEETRRFAKANHTPNAILMLILNSPNTTLISSCTLLAKPVRLGKAFDWTFGPKTQNKSNIKTR